MKLKEKVLDDLTTLKLLGMHNGLKAQFTSTDAANMDFLTRLDDLLAKELEVCQNKKLAYLQKTARLRWPNMTVADLDFSLFPSLKQAQLKELALLNWVGNSHHIIITGATGTGKTSIACALANKAISEGIPVLYYRFNELILNLVAADKREKLVTFRRKLLKTPLLVLDDWGISPLSAIERHLLFELIESRDKKGSMLITSQYPVNSWYDAFQDPTLADATLDRIVHQTHEINLKGGSIRKAIGMQEMRHDRD